MAIALLIGLWIRDEWGYDRTNPNYAHIVRVMQNQTTNGQTASNRSMPLPLANELRTTYGKEFVRVVASWWNQDHHLAFGDKRLTKKGRFMEPGAAELLGLRMVRGVGASRAGDGTVAVPAGDGLDDPASILLSESAARAVFGDADPMGKTLTIDGKMVVTVKGVYADLPDNSEYKDVTFIAPFELYAAANPWIKGARTNWGFDFVEILARVADGVNVERLSAALRNSTLDKMKGSKDAEAYHPQVFLQPMSRWHLYGSFRNGVNVGGNIQFVWLFGAIGFFVLLLACINFMNLSTARSERRAREVGIRKAIGSLRGQLVAQFYCEALVVAVIAFFLAAGLVFVSLPYFNAMADKKIAVGWGDPWFWAVGLGFSGFTGLLAGSYPALYLSSFRPVAVLKGSFKAGRWAGVPRRALVVLQFTVSILLIIGTMVVYRQIQFARDRPVGYDREGLISMAVNSLGFAGRAEAVRQELLRTGVVAEAAIASSPATVIWDIWSGFSWRGKDPAVQGEFATISMSAGYGKALGWQFAAGRDFSRDLATDSSAVVINEAAVAFTGLRNPIGERIRSSNGNVYTVIGVVKNIVMESPYARVRQALYMLGKDYDRVFLFIRIKPGAATGTALSSIRNVFQRMVPSAAWDYQFVDEEYAKKFTTEARIGQIAAFFALFALFISGLGIFGMASFMAEQRRREIGVRRVLGATAVSIWGLLSREFVVLVGLSFAMGGPLGYYSMHRWLSGYALHAGIPWWVFAVTGAGVLAITLATVSFQSVRAALANPVRALRSE